MKIFWNLFTPKPLEEDERSINQRRFEQNTKTIGAYEELINMAMGVSCVIRTGVPHSSCIKHIKTTYGV